MPARRPASSRSFANTPAQSLIVEGGRIKGVVTHRGTIMADHVVVCAGIWGRLIAEMVGEDLPVMPVDHPLTFFGPVQRIRRHRQGHRLSADARPGQLGLYARHGRSENRRGRADRVGLLRDRRIRGCAIRVISWKRNEARLSPSQRDLDMEQILEPLERAMELTPILGELGYNESHSFNGLLQVSAAGGRPAAKARRCAGCGTASPSGSRTVRATAS
jgi:glycine/D-amino acid oxidase-like deaminating enzyme